MLFLFAVTLTGLLTATGAQHGSDCKTPVHQPGSCVLVAECDFIRRVLAKPILENNDVKYIEASRCGTHQKKALVCCPLPKTSAPSPGGGGSTGNGNSDTINQRVQTSGLSLEDKRRLLPPPPQCGIQYDDRIVGGERTGVTAYPWLARVQHVDERTNSYMFHCGGSLINTRYVLTAAHCLQGIPKTWRVNAVRLGEWDTSMNPDCDNDECYDPVQDIPVEQLIPHENFINSRTEVHNDIALLRLASEAVMSETVTPICLPLGRNFANAPANGRRLFVAGWGQTETEPGSRYKQHVTVPKMTVEQCQSQYPAANINDRQICAGGEAGRDSCRGDSGGPLMDVVEPTRQQPQPAFYLMGVVSFGRQCGTAGVPGVYTNINRFEDWILNHIEP